MFPKNRRHLRSLLGIVLTMLSVTLADDTRAIEPDIAVGDNSKIIARIRGLESLGQVNKEEARIRTELNNNAKRKGVHNQKNPGPDAAAAKTKQYNAIAREGYHEMLRLTEELKAVKKRRAEKGFTEFVTIDWARSKPPTDIKQAVDRVLDDVGWPVDVARILSRSLAWKTNGPQAVPDSTTLAGKYKPKAGSEKTQPRLLYTVWVINGNTLAIGPDFHEFAKTHGDKALVQLMAFEFGKMIYQNSAQRRLKFVPVDESMKNFNKFSGTISRKIRSLSHVPELADLDEPSRFGYVYYHFLFDQGKLRSNGLGELVDHWNRRPPHATFKPH